MNENILKKWKALYDKWKNKKSSDYVDAKSDSGAAKPKDRKGVYVVPSQLDYAPGQYDIPHALAMTNADVPHWNYQADPDDRESYEKIKKTQHMKDTGVEPIDRELTDFEAARTLSKWEDEEDKRRQEKWKKAKADFDAIKAVQPTLDMKKVYPMSKKLSESKKNLQESKSIKIIFNKEKKK